jgi:hypothetical protein
MHDYKKETQVLKPWQKDPTVQTPWSDRNSQVSKEEEKK